MTHAGIEELLISGAGTLDLASLGVTARGKTRIAGRDQIAGPDQPVGHEDVDRRVVAFAAWATPKPSAIGGRKRDQFAHGRLATAAVDKPRHLVSGAGGVFAQCLSGAIGGLLQQGPFGLCQ